MEVREGYKNTEVGVIPENWEVKKLGEIAVVIMGQSPLSEYYNSDGIGLPLVQGNADIENRKTKIRFYTSMITKRGKKGDIIMSVRAPVGEISRANFNCCLGRGVCSISFDTGYLYHYLIYFEKSWAKLSTGSTFDSVNSKQVKELEIPIPILKKEQTAIATALSDADALINSLEKLIAKKRNIKQGAMQKLLQPKEGWEMRKFTDCADLKHGFQFREEHFSNDGIKVVKIGNLKYSGQLDLDNITFIPKDDLNKFSNFILLNGDILMALTGATLGKCSVVNTQEKLLQNYRVGNFINKSNTTKQYIYILLKSHYVQKTIKKLVNEAAQPNLGKGDFDKFIVPVPPTLEEQTRIATILSDMDAEIQALETKLEKYRKIKLGMMQNLLTGKIRLV